MKVYGQLEKAVLEKLASDPVSPVEGQIWYNTTEKLTKTYDGTSVVEVGGAGSFDDLEDTPADKTGNAGRLLAVNTSEDGIEYIAKPTGDSTVWKSWNAEDGTGIAQSTAGNDATFLNGGTAAGSLSYETVSPLSGSKSYKYTQALGSLNDWVASEAVTIPQRAINRVTSVYRFEYSYTGNAGDIDIVIWDNTNSTEIRRVPMEAKNGARILFNIPSGCTSVRVGFHCMTENVGAELVFDDVELSDDAFGSGEAVISETAVLSGYSAMSGDGVVFANREGNLDNDLFYIDTTAEDKIVFKKECSFVVTSGWASGASTPYTRVSVHKPDDSLYLNSYFDTSATDSGQPKSVSGLAKNGYYVNLRAPAGGTPDNSGSTFLSVTATASSPNILHESSIDSVGELIMMGAEQAQPNGTLYCDGSAVSRTGFKDLFDAIGESYGAGDGSTTFNLPDFRGYFPRGFDDGRGVDTGRVFGVSQDDALKSHNHLVYSANAGGTGLQDGPINAGGSLNDSYYTQSTGDTETRPKNIAVKFYIRYVSRTTTVQIPVGGNNDYLVHSSSTGVLSNFGGAANWLTYVGKNGTGVYIYDLNEDYFSEYPDMWTTPLEYPTGLGNIYTTGYSFPRFEVRQFNVWDNGSAIDFAHKIKARLDGADTKNPNTYVGEFKPEQVMLVKPSGSMEKVGIGSSTSPVTMYYTSLTGDIFGSLNSNQITLPKGKYVISVPIGVYIDQYVSLDMMNSSGIIETRSSVAESYTSSVSMNTSKFILETNGDTIWFNNYTYAATSGYMYHGIIEIRKLK